MKTKIVILAEMPTCDTIVPSKGHNSAIIQKGK